jgi:hypothetical protein
MWALAVLAVWTIFLIAYGAHHWMARKDPPKQLVGWWHGLQPGPHWTPKAWYDACQCSMERSKERRVSDGNHH